MSVFLTVYWGRGRGSKGIGSIGQGAEPGLDWREEVDNGRKTGGIREAKRTARKGRKESLIVVGFSTHF